MVLKREELAKSVVDDYQAKDRSNGKATDEGLSGVYETYATLFMERFDKTKDNRSLDAAFGAFGKAIGFDPQDVTAYKNRGNAYRRKGDWDRAIADYDKSISLEPNDALSYGNRGYAYSNKSDWDRAMLITIRP